jgi:hypothetical protein
MTREKHEGGTAWGPPAGPNGWCHEFSVRDYLVGPFGAPGERRDRTLLPKNIVT